MTILASVLLLPVAALCSAVAFPAMLFERVFPLAPSLERLKWEDDRSYFHNLKNITTEFLRADPQWWSKFLSFALCISVTWGGLT